MYPTTATVSCDGAAYKLAGKSFWSCGSSGKWLDSDGNENFKDVLQVDNRKPPWKRASIAPMHSFD